MGAGQFISPFTAELEKLSSFITLGQPVPILSVPDISDTYNAVTNVFTHNVKQVSLSGTSFSGLLTSFTNFDLIYTPAIADAKVGIAGEVVGQAVLLDSSAVELTEGTNSDIAGNVGKYALTPAKAIWIMVAKGTYADIAAARTALGTMTLNYQLAAATTEIANPNGYVLDLSLGINFAFEVATATAKAISFLNVPTTAGLLLSAAIKMLYTAEAVLTFPTGTSWQDGLTPTWTAGKTYIIILTSYDNGTTWLASVGGEW